MIRNEHDVPHPKMVDRSSGFFYIRFGDADRREGANERILAGVRLSELEKNLKTSVYITTSLDGFIARKDGNLDLFDEANDVVPEGEDCGYRKSIGSEGFLQTG